VRVLTALPLLLLPLPQLSIDVPFFSMDLGLSSCVKVQGSAFPRYKAYWSCGMKVTGSSMCTPGDCAACLCGLWMLGDSLAQNELLMCCSNTV
jgi:hypothetical protein